MAQQGEESPVGRREGVEGTATPFRGEEVALMMGRGDADEGARELQQRLSRPSMMGRWERKGLRLISRDEGGRDSSDEEGEQGKEVAGHAKKASGVQYERLTMGAAPGTPMPGEGRVSMLTEATALLAFADAQETPREERRPRESVGRPREREVRGGWSCINREMRFGWHVLLDNGSMAAYFADGRTGNFEVKEWREIEDEARVRLIGRAGIAGGWEPGLTVALQAGAVRYLRMYMRERGSLPSNGVWTSVVRGCLDFRGEGILPEFECPHCRKTRRVRRKDLPAFEAHVGPAYCQLLAGGSCENARTENDVWEWATGGRNGDTHLPHSDIRRSSTHEPISEEANGNAAQGFSHQAKQFYKATGKFLQLPQYRGETSEVDFLSWQRGVERYFTTYGVEVEEEKVAIAADLLEGDTRRWWLSLWMSGRDTKVTTWGALLEQLRKRFIPPEGEMRLVGQWRRLQQTGNVAQYADYVFRLKALCDMGDVAEFKLVFFGLRPELQAEVRRQLRQRGVRRLELEELFAVAGDAELGLGRKGLGEDTHDRRVDDRKKRMEGKPPVVAQLQQVDEGAGSWGESSKEKASQCWVCDKEGHTWFTCPNKRRGMGCARCGSTAHRLRRCPQRFQGSMTKSTMSGWGNGELLGFLECTFVSSTMYDRPRLLCYKIRVGRKNGVEAMIDSGASVNCMDEQLLKEIGSSISKPADGALRYADRRAARVLGVAEVAISRGGHYEKVSFWVIRGLGVGLLLGDAWL